MSRRWLSHSLSALALLTNALSTAGSSSGTVAAAQVVTPACTEDLVPTSGGASSQDSLLIADDAWLTGDLPAQVVATVLSEGIAEDLPRAPARLQLTHMSLNSGFGASPRFAAGPVLFYLLSGEVVAYVEGEEVHLRPSDSVLIPMDGLYAVVNSEDEEATLLRLAVVPPDSSDVPVASVAIPTNLLGEPPTGPPVSTLLLRGEADQLPAGETRLFLSCLQVEKGADLGAYKFPGPIGLRVEAGQLDVDGEFELEASGCSLLEVDMPHTLQAGNESVVALLFGVIPEDRALWSMEANPTDVEAMLATELDCGAG